MFAFQSTGLFCKGDKIMRTLTKKQKKLLDKWYEQNKDVPGLAACDVVQLKEFSYDFLCELEEINDTEVLYQEINRYISDKASQSHCYTTGPIL